jgi:hypothetical protein
VCVTSLSMCACWNAHINGRIYYVHTQYHYAGIRTLTAQLVTELISQRVPSYSIAPWASIITATVRAGMLIFSGVYICMQGVIMRAICAHLAHLVQEINFQYAPIPYCMQIVSQQPRVLERSYFQAYRYMCIEEVIMRAFAHIHRQIWQHVSRTSITGMECSLFGQ